MYARRCGDTFGGPGSAYRIAFGPRVGQKVLTLQGAMPRETEEAKLRLGMAQLQSGAKKSVATQTLRSVKGTDGVSDRHAFRAQCAAAARAAG